MIGRISGQYGMDALRGKKSKRGFYSDEASVDSDKANFSSFGVKLARYSAELKNTPDVREDVVANYKAQIEAGTYVPSLDKVAHTLIIAGMLDME